MREEVERVKSAYGLCDAEADYFVFTGTITHRAYSIDQTGINILTKKGKVIDVVKASDRLGLAPLSKTITKNYICCPKHAD